MSSESRSITYRVVWPNGDVIGPTLYGTLTEAQEIADSYSSELGRLGCPAEAWPYVQAQLKTTVVTESDWVKPSEADVLFGVTDDEEKPVQAIGKAIGPPPSQVDEVQVARVKSGKLGFHQPCVICGMMFSACPHSVSETVALIKRVDPSKKYHR